MTENLPPQEPLALKVAVILVAHNQAGELRRALEAVDRSQQREQLEILVVDCASRDDTPSLAEQFPNITMQRLPHHFGATKALNIATRTARAEFLLLLSPEVEVPPELVSQLAARLDAASDAAAVCPLLVNNDGQPTPGHAQPMPNRDSLARVCAGEEPPRLTIDPAQESIVVPYATREALMVRKQFVAGMNYFDERFGEFWADADLAMKIRQAGKKIRLYPALRATWHGGGAAPSDTLRRADRINGAAALLGKYNGFLASFGFTCAAFCKALLRLDFSLAGAVLGGHKFGGEAKVSYPT